MTDIEKVKILNKQLELLIENAQKIFHGPFDRIIKLLDMALYDRITETTFLIKHSNLSLIELENDEVFEMLVKSVKALDEHLKFLANRIECNDVSGYICRVNFLSKAICLIVRSSMNIKYILIWSDEDKKRYTEVYKKLSDL